MKENWNKMKYFLIVSSKILCMILVTVAVCVVSWQVAKMFVIDQAEKTKQAEKTEQAKNTEHIIVEVHTPADKTDFTDYQFDKLSKEEKDFYEECVSYGMPDDKEQSTFLDVVKAKKNNAGSFKADHISEKDLKPGDILYFGLWGCPDCIAIHSDLEAMLSKENRSIYYLIGRGEDDNSLQAKADVEEFPSMSVYLGDGQYYTRIIYTNDKEGNTVLEKERVKSIFLAADTLVPGEKQAKGSTLTEGIYHSEKADASYSTIAILPNRVAVLYKQDEKDPAFVGTYRVKQNNLVVRAKGTTVAFPIKEVSDSNYAPAFTLLIDDTPVTFRVNR